MGTTFYRFCNYSGSICDRLVQAHRLNKDLVEDWYFKYQELVPRKQTLPISSPGLVPTISSTFTLLLSNILPVLIASPQS